MSNSTPKFFFVLLFCLTSQILKGQVANFTADDTVGCVPKIINFTNSSTGATSYNWNLGNGSTPASTDASGSYTTPGTYTVTLVAHNGGSSSTKTLTIHIYAAPTVSFNANVTTICPGTAVTFTSTSVPNSWGTLSNNWNFGDGGTSVSASPSYVYNTPGFYNVSLFATNNPGCTGTLTTSSYIHVLNNPAINFSATPATFCKTPAVVAFTNSSTGTGPLTYTWLFGDGGTSTALNPTHNYVSPGSFNLSLKVTDGNGCSDNLTRPSYINAGSLSASFTSTTVACANIPVSFNNTSSSHISSMWYFGDGGTSTDELPSYSYGTPGSYTIKLVIFDGTCYDSVTHTVNILPLPTGTFSSTPFRPCSPPVNVTYNASVAGGISVAWQFGDGSTATGPTTVKNYTTSVIDYVDMILTNASGCKNTVERVDSIYNLYLNPSATVTNGCAPLSPSFSVYAYSVVYNHFTTSFDFYTYPYPIASYDWDFRDGSPHGSGPAPSHVYTAPGVYNAKCTLTTSNGCTDTGIVTISIGKKPKPAFTMSPSHICAGKSIVFQTLPTTDTVDMYTWSYSDGHVDRAPVATTVVHTYTVPGIFTVSLQTELYGCVSLPAFKNDTVDSPNAVINLTYDCIPANEVTFKDVSLGDDTHLWQFGDATTSTVSNVVHSYPAIAPYTAVLSTYNAKSGCRDTTRVVVDLRRPNLSFTGTKLQLCRDQADSFAATVTGNALPVALYKWIIDGVARDSSTSYPLYQPATFHTTGTHTMSLLITDAHGCFDTLTKPNYILVAKPTDNFSFTPTSGCGPLLVNFTDATTDVAGTTITNYSWSYGDGATNTSGGPAPSHLYNNAGSFSVKTIVTDNLGCSDTLTNPTKVNVYRPVPAFTASSTGICKNRNVHFTNTSTLATSYLWLFGDGSASTLTAPDHIYSVSGLFTVKLVAYESHGCIDTLTRTNYINVSPSPSASFTMNDTFAVCPPLNVAFTNTSSGATSYAWVFGDGSSSAVLSPSEPYILPGSYTIRLVAKNSFACTDTSYGHVSIFGYKGAFKYTPVTGCSPLNVHFQATLSTVANITWDFSDGYISGPGLSDTISHVYTSPGAYIPKLILTDTSGCSSFSIGTDTIRVDTLTPDFTVLPNPTCKNNNVAFHDITTSLFSPPSTWLWSFGSGATSTAGTTIHVYTAAGTYPVTLLVKNAYGCSGTITKNIVVNPSPSPITGITTVCAGNTTGLTDITTGGTWTSSNSAAAPIDISSGIVSGISAGTSTIVYTAPTGCSVSTIVTINPNPSVIKGNTGICFGQSSVLSDSTASGIWSSSNSAVASITPGGLVTTVSLGTAVITYKIPTGCLSTAVVTVATAPVNISGNTAVCLGGTSGLSDAVAGGTWTSGNTSIATVDVSSGVVSGVARGTAAITYSLGTGCMVNTTATVIPTPAAITGASIVCAGLNIPLSDLTPGGKWTSSNIAMATIGTTSGIVTTLTGGTDTIYYTLSTGCAASKSILIYPTTPITGALSVCLGSAATLSNMTTGGTWISSTPLVATIGALTGVVTGKSTGTSVISYTSPTGCTVTAVVTVISTPAVITGPIGGVCVGNTAFLSDATLFGTWTSDNTSIATIDPVTGLVSGLKSGTVLINYSIGTGCKSTSTIVINPSIPITGPANVCVGQAITLLDTALGGSWNSSNTSVAIAGYGTGVVTGIAAGTATISYTLRTGCIQTYSVTTIALPPAITGGANICTGSSTRLSDALPGGTWTSDNTLVATAGLTTGIVTGRTAGTAIISYMVAGCPATVTITVNPLPAAITGSNTGCAGATMLLSDAAAGGVWSSSTTGIATIGSTSGLLTGILLGTTTITYTLPTGCLTTKTELINPPPPPIRGTAFACEGMTTTLSDIITGGTWSSSSSAIASIDGAGLVTGLSAGAATITYTAAGCRAYQTVTINPLPPAIMGNTAVCEGAIITLSDIGSGTWISSTNSIATIGLTSGIVTGIAQGIDIITYTLGSGCLTTATILVNPAPAAITGVTSVCTTLTTNLYDATGSGNWSSDATSIAAIDASGLVTGALPGTATISYTLATGCTATIPVRVYPFPTAIQGPANICQSTPVTLTDTVTGGVWTSDNTAVATIGSLSGVVTGLSLSTTVITYSIGSGCYVTTVMSVVPLPDLFTISGGGNYCSADSGQHILLSGSVTGINYFLYNGGTIATGPLSGTGAPLDFGLQKAPGKYTIAAANALTGCSSLMTGSVVVSVTASVIPAIKLSAGATDTICNGATVNLTTTVANGGTAPFYTWYINGTKVSTANAYSYIPADKDRIVVRLTSNAPCAEPDTAGSTRVLTVIVPATPSATLGTFPGDTICSGEKITLIPKPLFGGSAPTYTWIVNTVPVGTGSVFTYVPVKGDIVYAQMTSNFPCLAKATVASNNVAVTVEEPLVPSVSVTAHPGANIAAGSFDTLTAVAVNAGDAPTYQWLINGLPIENATNSTYISNKFSTNRQDSVSCVVTSSSICKITTHGWLYIFASSLGVKNVSGEGDISIIPNPNKGEFVVKGSLGTINDEDVFFEITDMLGQVVYKNKITVKNGIINERVLLSSSLANSMYILNVRSGSATKVFHIVVER